jgi:hypothetical protein
LDWGLMANVGGRTAIGASFFALWDDDGCAAGPAVRYRRWLRRAGSLDVAIGAPITGDRIKTGSLYGLVKWNPVHWFGVALRPEFVRQIVNTCGVGTCTLDTRSRAKLWLGVEFGWVPGLVLPVATGVAALVAWSACGCSGN